jgi:hypothetical protein
VRSAQAFGPDDYAANLVLLGGPVANSISRRFLEQVGKELRWELQSGLLFDRAQHGGLIPEYREPLETAWDNVVADYAWMVYRRNPFAPSREARVLLLAGIKGYGTRAAAEAVALPAVTKHLEQLLADGQIGPADVASQTLEAVARVRIAGGTLLRDTLQVEAVRVGPADWAAETYSLVKSNRLDLEVGPDEDWVGSIRVNGMEMSGRLSLDSREIVLLLARRRREDYLGGAAREGYMTAQELAKAQCY